MPVVFQPPGPFAPGAAIGGGAAEVIERTLPSLVQQQAIQAQLAENYQRVAQARDAEADRDALARQQLAQQGQVTPRDVFQVQTQAALANQHTQAQAALAAQHARLQAEVHFGALSQAEQFRLQQLQQGINTVDEQVSKGVLSEEEGNQYKLMLKTRIDPLQQRLLKNQL